MQRRSGLLALDICLSDIHTDIVRISTGGGDRLVFFARGGVVTLDDIEIGPLLNITNKK
jgi:hypothetical protein